MTNLEPTAPRRLPLRDILLIAQAGIGVLHGAARLVREVRQIRRRSPNPKRPARRTRPRTGRRKGQPAMQTVTLCRPVGQAELDLIEATGNAAFPPRLAQQPIFYPVLNEEYATEIARDWNTKDPFSQYVGYVTRFAVRADFLSRYEVKTVGAERHQEYWIPAEDLPAFNACIVGPIEVVATFRGANSQP